VGNRQIEILFLEMTSLYTLEFEMLFDVLNAYKVEKLTKILSSKDGSMKRQKYFFWKKTDLLKNTTKLVFFSLNY
jgi:hypothetical protein